MCKLFDKIFQLPFKRWVAKEDKKQLELVVPIDSEDLKKLMNEIANKINQEMENKYGNIKINK